MEFTEHVPTIGKIKEFVDWSVFSDEQKWVIYQIAELKLSWERISKKWEVIKGDKLYPAAIKSCLLRSALSRKWVKGANNGNINYLCDQDNQLLKEEVHERAMMSDALTTISIRDEAVKLKTARFIKGANFLREIGCERLATNLDHEESDAPSRSWINGILTMLEATMQDPIFIDGKRFYSCTNQVIDDFFTKFSAIIANCPEELRYTADETMMETTRSNKVIIPAEIKRYIEAKTPEMPHITAMCCTNVIGSKPPLFVIIQKCKNIPKELQQLSDTKKIWLIATNNGWMDRWAFLVWTFFFSIFYRNTLDELPRSFAEKTGVMICDRHTSRGNPLALTILKKAGLKVIILPAHTTHVLQLFDVGLASPLKSRFTQIFQSMLKKKENYVENNITASMRKIAIEAFIEAWDCICNKGNCEAAARSVGIKPVTSSAPKESIYVRDPTDKEVLFLQSRRKKTNDLLSINNSEITDDTKLEEIISYVKRSEKDKDLCRSYDEFTSDQELWKFICDNAESKGVSIFSTPPSLHGVRFD